MNTYIIVVSLFILSGIINTFLLIVSIYCSKLSSEAIKKEKKAKEEAKFLRHELEEMHKRQNEMDFNRQIIIPEVQHLPVKTIRATKYYPKYDIDLINSMSDKDLIDRQIKEDLLWAMRDELTKAILIKDMLEENFETKVFAEISVVGK